MVSHRFVYFIDAADGRGKVLYLRHDGDYGLMEPDGSDSIGAQRAEGR